MDTLTAPDLDQLSRRSFLKLAGAALLALFWQPGARPVQAGSAPEQVSLGRILATRVNLRQRPSLNANVLRTYTLDTLLPITAVTVGEEPSAYNRVWYQTANGGYVHSGGLQPVELRPNPAVHSIPAAGRLAEVTVPYTDAFWGWQRGSQRVYRFYYSTTHWVTAAQQDEKGKWWYRVFDDKKHYSYWVDATHLRLIEPSELAPLSPEVPAQEKRLEVRLEEQVVVAFEDDRPVFLTRAATGAKFRDGDFRTAPGVYETNRKRPSRHMAAGEPGLGTGYDLPGVPWVSYLTKSGVSFHGTFWHNDFGSPRSHGCINLSPSAARWVFLWTLPSVPNGEDVVEEEHGTVVTII